MQQKMRLLGEVIGCCLIAVLCACTNTPGGQPITVTIASTGYPSLDRYRASRVDVYMDDYGQLDRYRDANAKVRPPAKGENRVVFFGDSITQNWNTEQAFHSKAYMNRGISGQTTSQMLVRFRQDVLNLQPEVVVILAGTNDIGGNSGPVSNEDVEQNFADLAELARAHAVRVVFASILPVNNYTPQSKEPFALRPIHRILELNAWLKDYCAAHGFVYLDYFAAMVDEKGYLRRDLADDGIHPNNAGYSLMAPLAQKAIDDALKSPIANLQCH